MGYSRFQVTGTIEGFLGLKFSIPNFFFFLGGGGGGWVEKFGKYFFGKGFFGGIQDSKFANTSNCDQVC